MNGETPTTKVLISSCGELESRGRRADPARSQSAIADSETDDTITRERRRKRRYSSQSPARSRSGRRSRQDRENRKHHRRHSRSPDGVPSTRDRHRRRSDHVRDETRRGRELRKTSTTPGRGDEELENGQHRRKRSPSPSRGPVSGNAGDDVGYRRRPSLPNHYKRYHGQGSFEFADSRRHGYRDYSRGERNRPDDGRLGGGSGGWDDDLAGGGGIKFKGRGSMKYRERQR